MVLVRDMQLKIFFTNHTLNRVGIDLVEFYPYDFGKLVYEYIIADAISSLMLRDYNYTSNSIKEIKHCRRTGNV